MLPIEVPLERVSSRRALRSGLAAHSELNQSIAAVRGLDAYQQKALSLLTSSETQRAFDIDAEDPAAPRPLRPDVLRPERAHGPAAGRGRRAIRHGLLFSGHQWLGHSQRQLQHAPREAAARHRSDDADLDRGPRTRADCSTRRWSSGPARWVAHRRSTRPPDASTGRNVTRS